ncbi:MAG: methyltransferase domain-containing protein, partial [Candidatus Omnitrophica bacterium]|nr:methyltransferase domain-containing protein [Candidatus Omnitrophota bacterium]
NFVGPYYSRSSQVGSSSPIADPAIRRISTILQFISDFAPQVILTTPPAQGLEIGVDFGYLLFSLATAFPQIDWHGLEHASRKFISDPNYRRLFEKYNCKLHLTDVVSQPLPYADNSCSIVTFSEVLEHISPDRVPALIREIYRVLRPGGWLIISSPNLVCSINRIKILAGKSILEPVDAFLKEGDTYGHIRLYTAEEFTAMAKRCGYIIRHIRYENILSWNWYSNSLLKDILYRIIWLLEGPVRLFTDRISDTWYAVLQKEADRTGS